MQIETRTLPAMRLAYMRYTGPYGTPGIAYTWERFVGWCISRGLTQPRRKTYGLSLDDPATVDPARCRYDCAIGIEEAFEATLRPQDGVAVQDFAGGTHACTRFTGTAAEIGKAWHGLLVQIEEQGHFQFRPGPGVEIYDEDYEMDPATGAFSCWLCVPVV